MARNIVDWTGEDEELASEPPAGDATGDLAAMFAKFLEEGRLAKTIQTVVKKQVATALAIGKVTAGGKAKSQVGDNVVRGDGGTTDVAQGGSAHGDVTPRSVSSGLGARLGKTSSTGAGCAGGHSRPGARAGGEIIEPFDPDDEDGNIDRWLNKIDQLGGIHGWSDYEKSCFMQAKLRGAARGWFNRLEEYDLSWGEWKGRLQSAFPRRYDFAELLEELVARRKLPSESMTWYYHSKLALCRRCNIAGEDAVSCIIKGLPLDLHTTARAFKAKTPEEFYTGFLAGLDRHRAEPDLKRRNSDGEQQKLRAKRPMLHDTQQATPTKAFKVRCYNCQELGSHFSRDCPRPRLERCRRCGKGGHTRAQCPEPLRRGMEAKQQATSTKEHRGQVKWDERLGNESLHKRK